MFKFFLRKDTKRHVDLETVRETLQYMETDCRDRVGLEGVAAALVITIAEIERVQDQFTTSPEATIAAARFIPCGHLMPQ